jgi:hypothetical protein
VREEQDFLKGFIFAEQVLFGLGEGFDFGRVIARLKAIARGDVPAGPTADEAVRAMERETGRSLPRNLRAAIYGGLSPAGVGDTDPRKAQYVLTSMGFVAADWITP